MTIEELTMRCSTEDRPLLAAELSLEGSPADLLDQIRNLFTELGILEQTLFVEYHGNRYRVSCSDDSFVVYRINNHRGTRHHMPGWPVCLVDEHSVFQEHTVPAIARDHCACRANIQKWLEIVELCTRGGCTIDQ